MPSTDIWLDIIAEMHQRRQIGLEQYKVPVTADPAVNWLQHLKEELLDAVVYAQAVIGISEQLQDLQEKYDKLLAEHEQLQNNIRVEYDLD